MSPAKPICQVCSTQSKTHRTSKVAKNRDMTLFPEARKKGHVPVFIDPHQALSFALKNADKKDLILVTGSFSLAGQLRTRYYSEEKILRSK